MEPLKKIAKSVLLSLLSFIVLYITFIIVDVAFISYGIRLNIVFDPPFKIQLDIALKLLAEYVILICILESILIIGGYPSHWSILAMEGIIIMFLKWQIVNVVFYQEELVYQEGELTLLASCLMVSISAFIMYIAWLSYRFKKTFPAKVAWIKYKASKTLLHPIRINLRNLWNFLRRW